MISFVLHPVQFKRYQKKIMKLESFIAETLCQIINGVSQASKYAQQNDAEINPLVKDFSHETGCAYTGDRITSVDFDVAVTASSETKKKENVGVSVVQVILGTERTKSDHSQEVSRIKFSVSLKLPTHCNPSKRK